MIQVRVTCVLGRLSFSGGTFDRGRHWSHQRSLAQNWSCSHPPTMLLQRWAHNTPDSTMCSMLVAAQATRLPKLHPVGRGRIAVPKPARVSGMQRARRRRHTGRQTNKQTKKEPYPRTLRGDPLPWRRAPTTSFALSSGGECEKNQQLSSPPAALLRCTPAPCGPHNASSPASPLLDTDAV